MITGHSTSIAALCYIREVLLFLATEQVYK